MTQKPRPILVSKKMIFVLIGFTICLSILFVVIREWIYKNDQVLPIEGYISNDLITSESIQFKLNDSLYLINLKPNENKELKLYYKLGLNRIAITLNDTTTTFEDTLTIKTRYPGIMRIAINNPSTKLEWKWTQEDDISKENWYNFKEENNKRIEIAIFRLRLE